MKNVLWMYVCITYYKSVRIDIDDVRTLSNRKLSTIVSNQIVRVHLNIVTRMLTQKPYRGDIIVEALSNNNISQSRSKLYIPSTINTEREMLKIKIQADNKAGYSQTCFYIIASNPQTLGIITIIALSFQSLIIL